MEPAVGWDAILGESLIKVIGRQHGRRVGFGDTGTVPSISLTANVSQDIIDRK